MAADAFRDSPSSDEGVDVAESEWQRQNFSPNRKHLKPVVIDASYRVGRRIGKGNFGEVRVGKL
jgi:hypothetical protein